MSDTSFSFSGNQEDGYRVVTTQQNDIMVTTQATSLEHFTEAFASILSSLPLPEREKVLVRLNATKYDNASLPISPHTELPYDPDLIKKNWRD